MAHEKVGEQSRGKELDDNGPTAREKLLTDLARVFLDPLRASNLDPQGLPLRGAKSLRALRGLVTFACIFSTPFPCLNRWVMQQQQQQQQQSRLSDLVWFCWILPTCLVVLLGLKKFNQGSAICDPKSVIVA